MKNETDRKVIQQRNVGPFQDKYVEKDDESRRAISQPFNRHIQENLNFFLYGIRDWEIKNF